MARFDLRCPSCGYSEEVQGPLGQVPQKYCPNFFVHSSVQSFLMEVYHGRRGGVPINFGFRESRYANKTDENIAKYQFEHL